MDYKNVPRNQGRAQVLLLMSLDLPVQIHVRGSGNLSLRTNHTQTHIPSIKREIEKKKKQNMARTMAQKQIWRGTHLQFWPMLAGPGKHVVRHDRWYHFCGDFLINSGRLFFCSCTICLVFAVTVAENATGECILSIWVGTPWIYLWWGYYANVCSTN